MGVPLPKIKETRPPVARVRDRLPVAIANILDVPPLNQNTIDEGAEPEVAILGEVEDVRPREPQVPDHLFQPKILFLD
jgi:hypothetical protein